LEPREDFLQFITAERLYAATTVFVTLTVLMVIMIYVYLYLKKKRFFVKKRISEILDEWISEALLEEDDMGHTPLTPELIDYFTDVRNRQYAIDLLISVRKNIIGQAAKNIVRLYEQLALPEDSKRKFKSDSWYIKAKGIYELYMMNQRDMKEEIAAYTNDDHEYVRTEAHTATIAFSGFAGLNFMGRLSYPLDDWQQLKILEQLISIDPEDMPELPVWLKSANDYVVIFALKLTEIYYQLHAHDEVVPCLDHTSERVRRQAIITLARISGDETASVLIQRFDNETPGNQRIILQQLKKIGGDKDLWFLERQLDNEDDLLKLESALSMAQCCTNGFELLEQRAMSQPEPYERIYKHVKQLNR
jgi:hypothetical protein